MNRRNFLKKTLIAAPIAISTPSILSATPVKTPDSVLTEQMSVISAEMRDQAVSAFKQATIDHNGLREYQNDDPKLTRIIGETIQTGQIAPV